MVKFNFNVPKCKRQTKISFDKTGIDYSSNKTDHFHTICDENGNALSPTDLLNYAGNSINNISSNSDKNNLSQSNDLSTMDNIEEWIDYLNTTAKELKSERDALTGEFNKFLSGAKENKFDGLWNDGYVYYPPNELKENQTARDQFLANNGYTLNIGDSNYFVGVEAFNQYVDNEYTELFDKYLKKEMNMTYDEYLAKIYQYNADLSRLENGVYNLRQQYKEQPYLEIAESDDYKKWLSEYTLPQILFGDRLILDKYIDLFNGGFDGIDKYSEPYSQLIDLCGDPNNILTPDEYCDLYVNQHMTEVAIIEDTNGKNEKINELRKQAHAIYDDVYYNALASYIGVSLDDIDIIKKYLEFSYEWKYLTDDEKKMCLYLDDEDKIRDYLSAIKDKINQRAGREEADEFLAKITDENGNINYNLASNLLANGKGILMGISNFGEGLSNVFNSEGVISDNQYAQMYIMEGITNTSGIYINELIQNISEREGSEQAEEFAKKIYNQGTGKIDLEYAKTVLNSDEYKTLEYKVEKDENTLIDNSFELGTSFGNMLPSMAATFTLSALGAAPAAVSIFGNTMMGLSSGGNARNQALISGNSGLSSTVYGILSGVSETCFGMLLGNIPGLNTSASLSFKGIFKEGMEEYLQEYIDAGLKSMILGEDINFDEVSQDAFKSFIYGCMMSFGTNLVSVGAKIIINGKSVELNSIEDYKSFFQILNDSDISISSREDGTNVMTAKEIVIDENISNKAEMIDIMKNIFEDTEVYTKIENENYIYDGHISQAEERLGGIGFQFFGGHKAKELTETTYNSLVSGMELQDAKYGNGAAIKALYNYLYDNGDINQLSRDGGLRSTVESLSFHELNSFYNKISEVYLKSSSYSNGLNSNTSYVRNYSTEHGFQVGADDFGDGWLSVQIKNGFIKQEQLNNMISNLNNKGYIGTDVGKYIDNVFDGNSDVYLKTVHSSDVNSIFEQGIRCLGTSTSGFGTAPLDISEISLENVVTKVEGIYDLVALLKNSNGISQGGNPIDGAVIIKVPKGAQVSDMVYFNNDTNTYCINSGFIDSFLQCDSYGTIDSPVFNKQSFGKNTQNNVNIDSVNNYNSQNINSIRTLEQEILANLPNTDDVTKIRYLYLELNKRLNYDINYFAGDNNTKSEIYNNYLTFESLSNNSVICKGWSELYKQLLIDAGIPENCIRICGSDVSGSHRWVEISMGDHFIRCDATQRFNGSIDLANAKSGASTVGFVYLSNEWAGKSFAYNMPGTEEEISFNDSWLRNIDQQLGYASNGIYFNELSDSLVSEFYKPGLFEKVFGINQDKLLEKKKEILLNYELPDGMKAIEAKNFFDTLKHMLFQNTEAGVEIEFGYRQFSSNAYSGVVMILEHDSNGIECRIIDDYSDSFIVHFQNLHEYEEYLNANGIK